MAHVLFQPHDHANLGEQPAPLALFDMESEARARLAAQTLAKGIAQADRGSSVHYLENMRQGPGWVLLNGGQSVGTFFTAEQLPENAVQHRTTDYDGMFGELADVAGDVTD
jgi:hypothetical protein